MDKKQLDLLRAPSWIERGLPWISRFRQTSTSPSNLEIGEQGKVIASAQNQKMKHPEFSFGRRPCFFFRSVKMIQIVQAIANKIKAVKANTSDSYWLTV